jgi:hypothetical protein
LVFEKSANFFAENWQKLQKIVIITLTPGTYVILEIFSPKNSVKKLAFLTQFVRRKLAKIVEISDHNIEPLMLKLICQWRGALRSRFESRQCVRYVGRCNAALLHYLI